MTPVAIVTGAAGLVGSEAVRELTADGFDVIGVDNNMRARLFGPAASTSEVAHELIREYESFNLVDLDIRDQAGIEALVRRHARHLEIVVHAAAQPSHEWAETDPHVDFQINAAGTLNLLEALRAHRPEATFVFMSTNKVYGDLPNRLPLIELETRLDLPLHHEAYGGMTTSCSIDRSSHSLFGVSKAAADLLVQEYGRAFQMPTVCFRAGCLTGPAHAGAQHHGFLSYLMRCVVSGTRYIVYGHGGKQVRDNLHARDLVTAFRLFHKRPRTAAVYNIGGGRATSVSVIEAIRLCEQIAGRRLDFVVSPTGRRGDHRWWISDLGGFTDDYPEFAVTRCVESTLREIHSRFAAD